MEVEKGEELYLTYANNRLCHKTPILAHEIEGTWLTTGGAVEISQG